MRKKRKLRVVLILATLIFAGIFCLLDRHMRPIVREYAVNQAKILSGEAMTAAVNEVLCQEAYSYGDLVAVRRNDAGEVLSVETETVAVNSLCNAIITSINERLTKEPYSCLKIPLANATGSMFTMGRGPAVTMRILQSSAATTNVNSVFSDAGINQTLHRLELTVSYRSNVLVYGMTEPIETTGTFLITETVIVGGVPNTYANIDRVS